MMDCPGAKITRHPSTFTMWRVTRRGRGAAQRNGSRSSSQLVCTGRRFAVTVWREMQMEGEEVIFY